ncbi:MAG: hypothetical protein JKY90_01065 [Gammaproteobacteria bacterium]|nr:hypothetical protein [Gammaproteobacteria bacterium]
MTIRYYILAALLQMLTLPAFAQQRIVLDDSLSPQQTYSLDLKWSPQDINQAISAMLNGQPSALPPLTGRLPNVDIRLNTRDFIGQAGRIFLSLPITESGTHSPSNIQLSWRTRGNFLSGSVRPGQSTLVFDGIIDQAITSDVFDFILSIENGDVPDNFTLEPDYEIEIIP